MSDPLLERRVSFAQNPPIADPTTITPTHSNLGLLGSGLDSGTFQPLGLNISIMPTLSFTGLDIDLPEAPTRSAVPSMVFAPEDSSVFDSLGLACPASTDGDDGRISAIDLATARLSPLSLSATVLGFGDASDPQAVCQICHRRIEARSTLFLGGLPAHRECLKCWKCNVQITGQMCVVWRRGILCQGCGVAGSREACRGCGLPIEPWEERVGNCHSACFVCFRCCEPIAGTEAELVNGEYFCQRCAGAGRRMICGHCGEAVFGDGIRLAGRYFHREHFFCCICRELLRQGTAVSHHGKFYCPRDGSIYSQSCEYCKNIIEGPDVPQLAWRGKRFHKECFVCRVCGQSLDPLTTKHVRNRPHCVRCWQIRQEELRATRHIPEQTVRRRADFQERGITIIPPRYGGKTALLETVDQDHMDAKSFEPIPLRP
jgi:hypothetical protein